MVYVHVIALVRSINDLLDDALNETGGKPEGHTATKVTTTKLNAPDLSFLREGKDNMTKHKWWKEIFDQPSFCTAGSSRTSSVRTCSHCERRHSTDQQVILFQVKYIHIMLNKCIYSLIRSFQVSSSQFQVKWWLDAVLTFMTIVRSFRYEHAQLFSYLAFNCQDFEKNMVGKKITKNSGTLN